MNSFSAGVFCLSPFCNLSSSPSASSADKKLGLRLKLGLHALGVFLLVHCGALPSLAINLKVTNKNDSGPGSLRSALSSAANGDTINFSVTGTITLTSAPLVIGTNVIIKGPGAAHLAINGNSQFTVFKVDPAVSSAVISGVTIENGSTLTDGGGISNQGTLAVSSSIITGNTAGVDGDGIYNSGTLLLNNTTLSSNHHFAVAGSGGGIYNTSSGKVLVSNSSITSNADNDGGQGGGIYNGGTMAVSNSTVSDNFTISGNGAGIFNVGSLAVSGSTISGNGASGGDGGGINNSGTLTMINSTLSGNFDGGGFGAPSSIPARSQ
jgi:hypothetical protein